MDTLISFRENFSLVRKTYGLNIYKMANLLGLKSPSLIGKYEKGAKKPSLEVIISFCNIFSVNFDWLCGKTKIIYIEDDILFSENKLLSLLDVLSKHNLQCDVLRLIPEYYFEIEKRRKQLSLEVRANIIFLLYYFVISYITELIELDLISLDILNELSSFNLCVNEFKFENFLVSFDEIDSILNLKYLLSDTFKQPLFHIPVNG